MNVYFEIFKIDLKSLCDIDLGAGETCIHLGIVGNREYCKLWKAGVLPPLIAIIIAYSLQLLLQLSAISRQGRQDHYG